MIVADASVVLELLLRTAASPRAASRLLDPEEPVHAPHLLDLEVLQAVRRYRATRQIGEVEAAQAIEDLQALPIHRHPHAMLIPRIWELRQSTSAYDAAYLALAEGLDATFVTCDGKLARSHGHRAKIEVL